MASGLLIVAINDKTADLHQFLNEAKTYRAVIEFNTRTDTGDGEGKIIATAQTNVTPAALTGALDHFNGLEYFQQPHKFSAVKVAGKRLYEYAREGKNIQINARKVKINTLKLLQFAHPQVHLELNVTKGFYVRSFAEDLAAKLNTVGYLKQLVRTECKGFVLDDGIVNVFKLKKSLKAIKKY